jgi:hypothetical protein
MTGTATPSPAGTRGRADDTLWKRAVTHPVTTRPGAREAKRAAKAAVNAYALATARRRRLPDLVLAGAQRSGTTALMAALHRSPVVARPRMGKGAHYFSYNHWRGAAWYRSQFPTEAHARRVERRQGERFVVYDACPYYLFHPLAIDRIAAELPQARILLMLRDPVRRAHSHWVHSTAHGHETLGFEEALDAEPARLAGEVERIVADDRYHGLSHEHHSYVAKGCYAPQVERVLARIPRDRVLVVPSERFYRTPDAVLDTVTTWIGTRPVRLSERDDRNGHPYDPMEETTRRRLALRFEESNERLFALLGERFDWTRP